MICLCPLQCREMGMNGLGNPLSWPFTLWCLRHLFRWRHAFVRFKPDRPCIDVFIALFEYFYMDDKQVAYKDIG